ncbi:paralemmin-3 isoform X2 [Antennarius striatus]
MDEAEKYKQRLEVIAEKRRKQEEQDKVRREMEEEKLRLQQLKRKSLRDQWLMEGAPLSPTSPDARSPHSPLWGSQALGIEKHIEKLQSQSQQLEVEKEKLKEQMEDGREVVTVGERGSNMTEDDVKMYHRPEVDEPVALLTNGGGSIEVDAPKSQSTTNGPVVASEGIISMDGEPGLCVSETEPYQLSNVSIQEEDDGTVVIRAERVIVTDEDDELPEGSNPQEDQGINMKSEEAFLPRSEAGLERGDSEEEIIKTVKHLESFVQPEFGEKTKSTETEAAFADGDMPNGVKEIKDRQGETKDAGLEQLEHSSFVQVQPLSHAIEDSTMLPIPVYSQIDPNPELGAESAGAVSPERAEAASKGQESAIQHDQFQDVPLADPQENQKTEGGPEEQDPLLSEVKSQNTQAEAAVNVSTSAETHIPVRATQGGDNEIPKHKTCQCCSVM